MRATHAIFLRISDASKKEEKKKKLDIELLRKQQDEFRCTLAEAGVTVIELPPVDGSSSSATLPGDLVVVIRGIALMTRPKKEINVARMKQIAQVLHDLTWHVIETPAAEKGKAVVLDGADVLFTGREVFVGVRKGATNMEGVMVLARTFPDFPVVPIYLHDKTHPLRHYIEMVSDSVIAVGSSKEAQAILKKVEHEAAFKYARITIDEESAVSCLNVNDRLCFRADMQNAKYNVLQGSGIQLWALDVTEMAKIGAPFTRFCVLLDSNEGRGKYSTLPRSITNGTTNGAATHLNGLTVETRS